MKGISQDLYRLIVAILPDPKAQAISGTGLIVSRDGLIVTCKHVVSQARKLKSPGDVKEGMRVGVRRSESSNRLSWEYWAEVIAYFSDYDDDIVLMKIDTTQIVLELEQSLPVLGNAKQSFGHEFWSFGYGERSNYRQQHVIGTILGSVSLPHLRVEHIQLQPNIKILHGHSGSPVLDQDRNLIVGLMTRAAGDSGMATNCEVLGFMPFGLELQDEALPKREPRRPSQHDIDMVGMLVSTDLPWEQYGVPKAIPDIEWVGREDILKKLQDNWEGRQKRLITLNGFGGEGKSSIARRLLDRLQTNSIFWWSFYSKPQVDDFFEAALAFLTGRPIRPASKLQRISRIDMLGTLLACHSTRFLFVLDGLEVVQHDDPNQYGGLQSEELQSLLEFFAAPYHESVCLITSRTPLRFRTHDTFIQHDLDRLDEIEGRTLLRKLGVDDTDSKLDEVVGDWEGHALTLTLIGTYFSACHNGKVVGLSIPIEDLATLAADERRAEQVSRVLGRYDQGLLSQSEQIFLMIFSAFRLPVSTNAFSAVFRSQDISIFDTSLVDIDDGSFKNLVERLKAYRIIRYDSNEDHYTIHPLMRDHYAKQLTDEPTANTKQIHGLIKIYYLSITPHLFSAFTLKDLAPLVEAIYHACCAEVYDEAFDLYTRPLEVFYIDSNIEAVTDQPFSYILINWLGAYESARELLLGFFSGRDIFSDVYPSAPSDKARILKDAGHCFKYLSQLEAAVHLYQRAISIYQEQASWGEMSTVYYELSMLYISSGKINNSMGTAEYALKLVTRPDNLQVVEMGDFQESGPDMIADWSLIGFIEMLHGDVEQAALSFAQAKFLCRSELHVKDLPLRSGVLFTTYLWRKGERRDAAALTRKYLKQYQRPDQIVERSQLHHMLGNISAASGKHLDADKNYTEAVKLARGFSRRDILIEALAARGRWAASQNNIELAHADLEEALHYARGGYRLYEADVRVGLAIMHLAEGDQEGAQREAQEAERISNDIGYHWGLRDAADVLRTIGTKK